LIVDPFKRAKARFWSHFCHRVHLSHHLFRNNLLDEGQAECYISIMKPIIAYYRVSTRRQGRSGLGLEAQKAAVAAHAKAIGGRIVAEFTEVETGKRADRPQLTAALARAKAHRATLVIAKLDRLSRNVAFTSALMDAGVDFVACDNPHATRLTIHILAAVAEDEARRISERTKAALAAARRRGVQLGTNRRGHSIDHAKGTRNGLAKAIATAADIRRKDRAACYAHLLAEIKELRDDGESFAAIAARLNEAGNVTTNGKPFAAMSVKRICDWADVAA
jgi:DNA invertase Pin-like site-specific DNA recombinase